jgi:hypothetical protein
MRPRPRDLVPLRRLILSVGLVLAGALVIIVTVAAIYWPADLILLGIVLIVLGAFFVRIEPRAPREPR